MTKHSAAADQRQANAAAAADSSPASNSPPEVSTTSNADKTRQDELSARTTAYQSKTTTPSGQAIDNQERVTLGQIVFGLNEESANVSGSRGGLQAPKTVGAGAGR
jgi:hypothetical protein